MIKNKWRHIEKGVGDGNLTREMNSDTFQRAIDKQQIVDVKSGQWLVMDAIGPLLLLHQMHFVLLVSFPMLEGGCGCNCNWHLSWNWR